MTRTARCVCGAAYAPGATWCAQCYQTRPEPEKDYLSPEVTSSRATAEAMRRRREGVGRWDATTVTYGLSGRLLGTIVVTGPMVWFLGHILPFGFVGVVAYLVVYPRMLRDLWRRSDRL